MDNKHDMVTLEYLVDKYGPTEVLWMLARVCADKADHLGEVWQDETAAKQWEKRMAAIEKVAVTLNQ